jgi:hypothetical protein
MHPGLPDSGETGVGLGNMHWLFTLPIYLGSSREPSHEETALELQRQGTRQASGPGESRRLARFYIKPIRS